MVMSQRSLKRKERNIFVCTACDAQHPRWEGRCPQCGEWNTIEEQKVLPDEADGHRFAALAGTSEVQNLAQIQAQEVQRRLTGLPELDREIGRASCRERVERSGGGGAGARGEE